MLSSTTFTALCQTVNAMDGRSALIFNIGPLLSAFCVRISVAAAFSRCTPRMFAMFNQPPARARSATVITLMRSEVPNNGAVGTTRHQVRQ